MYVNMYLHCVHDNYSYDLFLGVRLIWETCHFGGNWFIPKTADYSLGQNLINI